VLAAHPGAPGRRRSADWTLPFRLCRSFKDAVATIRRTTVEFQYQLIITRAYEEGEAELLDLDAESESASGSEGASSAPDRASWRGPGSQALPPQPLC